MTAGALGRKVGVSESTVVRFAYALGYKGYPKLQKHLQEIIKNKLTTVQRLNFMEGLPTEKIIDTVLKMEITNLKATREELDIESIKDVVRYLVRARKIFVIGFRSSAPLAQFLVYYLSYIFENPQLITLGNSDVYSQLLHVTGEDVVIGLGFPRYSTQTVNGLQFAKSKHAKIVTITDNKISPLYELADRCIFNQERHEFLRRFLGGPTFHHQRHHHHGGPREKAELAREFQHDGTALAGEQHICPARL